MSDLGARPMSPKEPNAELVDQAQDRGIEAVRPGAGRDEDYQHERIQDLWEIEPIVDPVRSIDRLVTFDPQSPRRDAGDEDDRKQAERGEGRKQADEDRAAGGEFDRWHPPLVDPDRRNVQGCQLVDQRTMALGVE